MHPTKRPTSRDVARIAGVDRSTVSIVVNDPETARVRSATKARILSAIEELGYTPNMAASQLRSGSSKIILMPFFSVPFGPTFDLLLDGVSKAGEERGYTLLIHGSRTAALQPGAREWARFRADIILVEAQRLDSASVSILRRAGAKEIFTIGAGGILGVPDVVALDYELPIPGRLAAAHLINRGAQDLIAVMPTDPALQLIVEPRLAGFVEAANAAGHEVEVAAVDDDPMSVARLVESLKHQGRSKIGVFAYSDRYALPILTAASRLGLVVPDDIAVIGIDNTNAASSANPPLTSITYDPESFGRSIVDAAVDRIDGLTATVPTPKYAVVQRDSA